MAFVPCLSVVLRHAFYGTAAPPVRLVLDDGGAFDRAGGVVKPRAARIDLYRPKDMAAPDRVRIVVLSTTAGVMDVTPAGGVPTLPVEGAPGGDVAVDIAASAITDAAGPRGPRDPIVILDVALPRDGGATRAIATLPTIATHWAYHVIGAADGLDVVEGDGRIAFDADGKTTLPDGRTARTWRSQAPVPLRLRQDFNLSLTRLRDFGPEPLIATLPCPSRATSKPAAASPDAALQSDIYVTL